MAYSSTDNISQYSNWTPNSANQDKNGNQYEVTQYPENLGSPRYPYYVLFYINANTKSKLVASGKVKTYDIDTTQNTASQSVTSAAQTNKTLTNNIPTWVASKKRISQALGLPMPVHVGAKYSATYGTASVSNILGAIFHDAMTGGSTFKNLAGNLTQDLPSIGIGIAGGIGGALLSKSLGASSGAGAIGGAALAEMKTENFQNLAFKAAGVARNNRLEQIFQQVDFRQFQMDWMFAPRSKSEADALQSIVQTFKSHMHPEFNGDTSSSGFLIMPDEFDIEFRFQDEQMNYIHKIATCALTNISLDYTPNNHFQAFNGTDIPVTWTLSMNFIELEPLTRSMIDKGGF